MANRVAVMIADFLCKNNTIVDEDKAIYIYGFEIFISNVINFILIMFFGILMGQIPQAVLFYLVFVITRSYSGGYHASTYLRCNILFTVAFFITILLSKLINPAISMVYLLVLLAIYIGSILEYAPIDSKYKRLSEEEKAKYRKISIYIGLFWTAFAILLYFVAKKYATTLAITLDIIAVLMLIEVNKRKVVY